MVKSLGRAGWAALGASAVLLALAGCDGGPASTPARDHSASASSKVVGASYPAAKGPLNPGGYRNDPADPRNQPIPLVAGKPMWAANRQHTAEENAQYHFERDGADFGARSVDDYVAKAHVFLEKPPKDILTLTRSNGDKLLYDPSGNVFAVETRDGAPRTMFKPRDGQAYWDQQKEREASRSDRYRADGSDNGSSHRYSRRASRGSGEDDQG
jgi:pyocin large subunit-like protein